MPVVARLIYEVVNRRARRGLTREVESFADAKTEAKQRGVRGEKFAYWYLRRQGYVFVARNPRGAKGEIDLVGCDGDTRAFVEVRTRTARRFLSERHVKECPMRFDVVAIEEVPGESPVVRLHKAAFYPQM
jgi:Holliday junction resolvase-like predicted endonuclease